MPPSYRSRLIPRSGPFGSKRFGVLATFVVGAVVAGEQHECVVVDAEFAQRIEKPADVGIEPSDHRRLAFVGIGQGRSA